MNTGKLFESQFKKSIPDYCFMYRLKDSAQSFTNNADISFAWNNPCDFFIFDSNRHLLYAVECKSTKLKSMSVQMNKEEKVSKMIKYHQIESLTEMSEYSGLIAGFILNFRDEINGNERTYFIEISNFNYMMREINKCSFNEMDIILYNAVKIEGIKKRVHYQWNIDKFLTECREK
ncbi:MAG: hypothetical protein NC548_42340 [Lachnospiraceae bacterium]|nr:hypothetical protein [Lachnospiraceae bacterium]